MDKMDSPEQIRRQAEMTNEGIVKAAALQKEQRMIRKILDLEQKMEILKVIQTRLNELEQRIDGLIENKVEKLTNKKEK